MLFTGPHLQPAAMSIEPGSEIGEETHEGRDQFLRIEGGRAHVVLGDEERASPTTERWIVPSGVRHNVVNAGDGALKVYLLDAPPEHPDGTVHLHEERRRLGALTAKGGPGCTG